MCTWCRSSMSSFALHLIWDQGLSRNPNTLIWLYRLASEPQRSSCLHFPRLGLESSINASKFSMCVLWTRIRSSCLPTSTVLTKSSPQTLIQLYSMKYIKFYSRKTQEKLFKRCLCLQTKSTDIKKLRSPYLTPQVITWSQKHRFMSFRYHSITTQEYVLSWSICCPGNELSTKHLSIFLPSFLSSVVQLMFFKQLVPLCFKSIISHITELH